MNLAEQRMIRAAQVKSIVLRWLAPRQNQSVAG